MSPARSTAMLLIEGCGGPLVATIDRAATARVPTRRRRRGRTAGAAMRASHVAYESGRMESAARSDGSLVIETGKPTVVARARSGAAVASASLSAAKQVATAR